MLGHLLLQGVTLFTPLFLLWIFNFIKTSNAIILLILYFSTYLFYKPHFTGNAWFSPTFKFHNFWEWTKHYTNFTIIRRGKTSTVTGKQYIFGVAPHGILCCNRLAMMGHIFMEEIYPCTFGKFAAATPQFYLPGTREISHWAGAACDASKKVLIKAINSTVDLQHLSNYLDFENSVIKNGLDVSGQKLVDKLGDTVKQSLYIWVGGSKELMTTDPDSNISKIVIKDRKGFVKLAIEQGIDIIPVMVFGEKYMYHRKLFPFWLRKLLYKWKVPGILFYGRFCTMTPYNMRNNTNDSTKLQRLQMGMVFGEPMKVNKQEKVEQEYLDEVHSEYMKQMQFLFDTYKEEMGYDESETLEFINTKDVGFI